MRVGLYARVSTKDQSCDMQLRDLRAYCAARQLTISREYVDAGVSGTKDSRPQLDLMMADVRKRKLDAVLVWRFDRFARSPKCHPAAKMGLVHRLGGGLGNSFRLRIGSSVTANENEMTAKSGVSGFRAHFSRRSSSVLTRDVGSSSSGSTIVAMMQATQPCIEIT